MSHPGFTLVPMPDNGERRLYATWRNPDGLIRPVGVLTRRATTNRESYRFVYLKAAGIRHRDGAAEAVDSVRAGDVLELADEPDNPVNQRAILVSTRTGHRVGWVPDCLLDTIHELTELDAAIQVTAEHVNPPTSPPHMRLLCRLRAPWPDGYEPLTGPDYQPIAS